MNDAPRASPLLSRSDKVVVVSGIVFLVGLIALMAVFERKGHEVVRMALPVEESRRTLSDDAEIVAERVVHSPEFEVDRPSVIEIRLERGRGDGLVSAHCALASSQGELREVVLESSTAGESITRTWVDRLTPGRWTLQAEAVWPQVPDADPPELRVVALLGQRSPYAWMIAAFALLLPPLFVLARAVVRLGRRRRKNAAAPLGSAPQAAAAPVRVPQVGAPGDGR